MSVSKKIGTSKNRKKSLSPAVSKMLRWFSSVEQECERLIDSSSENRDNFDYAAFSAWKVRCKICLSELVGTSHEYYKALCEFFEDSYAHESFKCNEALHLLKSIRQDIERGYLESYRGLVQGEIHSDFLEMAQHLFDQGYKDASAVIAGSVLEDHIKKLCTKYSISMRITKPSGDERELKTNELNESLRKQKIYELPLQQSVTGWLSLRNCAAHGEYEKYQNEEVRLLLIGVRQFIKTQLL